jgi:hypothetical protein
VRRASRGRLAPAFKKPATPRPVYSAAPNYNRLVTLWRYFDKRRQKIDTAVDVGHLFIISYADAETHNHHILPTNTPGISTTWLSHEITSDHTRDR